MNSPGVAARLRQWLSVKTVIKIAICYSVLQVTVLRALYVNFIGSILFNTSIKNLVKAGGTGVHWT